MQAGKKLSTRLPRARLLPQCLALALAIGSNVLAVEPLFALPAPSSTQDTPLTVADQRAMRRAGSGHLQQLVPRMRALARMPAAPSVTSIPVTNCDDSGPGSYRQAMTDAVSGDTIDLTATPCSLITLTTGDVLTAVDDLTLQGPGALFLTISGGYAYRPLDHLGGGTLSINDLSISEGHKYLPDGGFGTANGGCVSSTGTVSLDHSWLKYCDAGSNSTTRSVAGGALYAKVGALVVSSIVSDSVAKSTASAAYGGGIYTPGDIIVSDSTITGNLAQSLTTWGQGGGVQTGSRAQAGGGTSVKYSLLSDNTAIGINGIGGGLYTKGDALVSNSTFTGNNAQFGGAMLLKGSASITQPFVVRNSTISGNSAYKVGGIIIGNNPAQIFNSTIADNTAHTANKYGAGLQVENAVNVDLQSTLIAGNTNDQGTGDGPEVDDVGGVSGATLSGADNLIYFPSSLVTPGGTILLTDPLLRPFDSNGGSTATRQLNFGSPAINAGNNTGGFTNDQRGTGYLRNRGAGVDIGAIEFNLDDSIFADGFD